MKGNDFLTWKGGSPFAPGKTFKVNTEGVEPPTSTAVMWCTIQLCYASVFLKGAANIGVLAWFMQAFFLFFLKVLVRIILSGL